MVIVNADDKDDIDWQERYDIMLAACENEAAIDVTNRMARAQQKQHEHYKHETEKWYDCKDVKGSCGPVWAVLAIVRKILVDQEAIIDAAAESTEEEPLPKERMN